jgi:hypothetical protein
VHSWTVTRGRARVAARGYYNQQRQKRDNCFTMGFGGTSPLAIGKGTLVDEAIGRAAVKSKLRVQSTGQYRERLKGSADVTAGRIGVVISVHSTEQGARADVLWDNGKAFKGYCIGYRGFSDLELATDISVASDSTCASDVREARSRSTSASSSPHSTPETSGASTPVERSSHSPTTHTAAAGQVPPATSMCTGAVALQGRSSKCPLQAFAEQKALRAQQMEQQHGVLQARLASQGKSEAAENTVLDVNVGYLYSAPTVNHAGGKHIWMADGPISYK